MDQPGQESLGSEHPDTARSRNNLGAILLAQGEPDQAQVEYHQALAVLEKALGPEHPEITSVQGNLAAFHIDQGQPALALPLAERAWASPGRRQTPPENQGNIAFALARALWTMGEDRPRARELARESAQLYERAGETGVPPRDEVRSWLEAHP